MKNRYGRPLRRLVAERFHLKYYVDMTGTILSVDNIVDGLSPSRLT